MCVTLSSWCEGNTGGTGWWFRACVRGWVATIFILRVHVVVDIIIIIFIFFKEEKLCVVRVLVILCAQRRLCVFYVELISFSSENKRRDVTSVAGSPTPSV